MKHLSKFTSALEAASYDGELAAPHIAYVENAGLAYAGSEYAGQTISIKLDADGKLEIVAKTQGPAANEVWYTSNTGNVLNLSSTSNYGSVFVSNTYNNEQGVLKFEGPINEVPTNAFYYCDAVTSVIIPECVTIIGDSAFYECHNLQSLVIPSTVTRLGNGALFNCTSLESVTFGGTMEQWSNMSKGQSWKYNMLTTVIHCSDGDVQL